MAQAQAAQFEIFEFYDNHVSKLRKPWVDCTLYKRLQVTKKYLVSYDIGAYWHRSYPTNWDCGRKIETPIDWYTPGGA